MPENWFKYTGLVDGGTKRPHIRLFSNEVLHERLRTHVQQAVPYVLDVAWVIMDQANSKVCDLHDSSLLPVFYQNVLWADSTVHNTPVLGDGQNTAAEKNQVVYLSFAEELILLFLDFDESCQISVIANVLNNHDAATF